MLAAVFAASASFLLALTEAGSAVQGVPHARAFAAALAVGGALASYGAVWAASGRNPFGRWRPRGHAPERVPRRLVAARIALILAALVTTLMILALPRRDQTREELVALAALGAVAGGSIIAAVLITRRPPYGRAMTIALGAYGLCMAAWRLPSMLPVIGPDAGPGAVILLLIVGTVWAALVFAGVCVVSLRGAWPPTDAV